MEHWERLCEGGLKFVYGDGAFPPSTDSFLLSSLPRLKKGDFIYVTGRVQAKRRDYFCIDRVEEIRRQETRP